MSGAQTSTFGNVLFNAPAAYQAAQQYKDNELLMQQHQQQIGAADTEMAARIAGSLLTLPDEQARAAAYPTYLAQARANNYRLPHAPETYPGEAAIRVTAQMGTPSADLYKLGVDRQAKGAIAPGDGGTTATGTGGGGGGGTGGGGGGTGTVGGDTGGDGTFAANNPLNIRYVGQPGAANTRGFAAFKTPEEGLAATDALFGKYADSGINTLSGLIFHWAPPSENNTPAYIASVAKATGLDPNAPIDLKNPAVARKIQRAMATVEGNKNSTLIPDAPGGATAPAVVTGDVGRPGDVPPPPGGAPGAYGGGGMGAAIGGQPAAARATIPAGRPTGPPVITDQPAGSNVVAGPPGVATVGAPQPPGPAVPGNVAAINAGIAGAGGQPVTDPNLTPTPARYAGTAPAPSVEAAPQPGWGTGIGSGYGPQNALAPAPVQPAPVRPATPAQPAAAQPPAADTLPPLPAPTPPAPTNRNGLTALQQQDIERRRGMTNVSSDELQKRVDSYVATNAAVAEKFQQDQIAYVREMRERQTTAGAAAHQTLEEQRQAALDKAAAAEREYQHTKDAETQRLALETAARERAKAVDLTLQGGDDGSANYAAAYATKAAPTRNPDGSVVYPVMLAYDKPTYRGGKGQVAEGQTPDYAEQKTTPPTIMTAPQTLAAGYADRMRDAMPTISDTSEAAMNRWQMILGKTPFVGNAWVSPEFQQHVQAERNFITSVLRRESGATIQPYEFDEARAQYIPQPGDKPPVLADKARNRERVLNNLVRDAGPAYKPPEPVADKPPSKDRPPLSSFRK